jgi:putative ABC transport system permease protein
VREVVVGRKAAQQFAGLEVGSRIAFRDSDWTVVGIFTTGGDVHESEIMADAEVAMSAFRRTGFQSVTATLADGSEAGLAALVATIKRDPRLSINVLREPEYYAKQAGVLSRLITVIGYTVAVFMAVGRPSARSTACTRRSPAARSRSPPCARSASAARRSWSRC